MIGYRAATSMASLLRESITRNEDILALLRQIYNTEADLFPDAATKTLYVRLHHLTQSAHDRAFEKLCHQRNGNTVSRHRTSSLVFKVGSS